MSKKEEEEEEKQRKMWCVHDGETTLVKDCSYTINMGLTCSMAHKDQPNGKFSVDNAKD